MSTGTAGRPKRSDYVLEPVLMEMYRVLENPTGIHTGKRRTVESSLDNALTENKDVTAEAIDQFEERTEQPLRARIAGKAFSKNDPAGLIGRGVLAAVWDTQELEANVVYGETSDDSGDSWSPTVQLSTEGAKAGHPFLVRVDQDLRAFWFEGDEADEQLLMTALLGAQ